MTGYARHTWARLNDLAGITEQGVMPGSAALQHVIALGAQQENRSREFLYPSRSFENPAG